MPIDTDDMDTSDAHVVMTITYRPAAHTGRDARRQAECVRLLRNEVRASLTRTSEEITSEAQWTWWRSNDALARYIFTVEVTKPADPENPDPTFAGFGMIHPVNGEGWLTGALRPQYRGHGHGRSLFQFLVHQCQRRGLVPWLEVFADNEVAKGLYAKLGFVWCDAHDGPGRRRILVGKYVGVAG